MKTMLFAISALCAIAINAATTTNNNDSCDISVLPAATLLLPYFEVDANSSSLFARTTLFTVVNTSQYPQIARVTLWTDLGYPVLTFNLFLTGYDAQSINLYDILQRGMVAPPFGARPDAPPGYRSLPNGANPNFAPDAVDACATNPGPLPSAIVNDIDSALLKGRISGCGTARIGLVHVLATGYATIDVVRTCGLTFPTNPAYYDELLYDNVLTGDYQIISPNLYTGNYAAGNPLVHIRAIPEGGPGGITVPTDLPYTFYDRYTLRDAPAKDRRQPLPALFAAHFIEGGAGGFNTNFLIWREGLAGANAACTDYEKNNSDPAAITNFVRFDEHENPTVFASACAGIRPCPPPLLLPETSSLPTSSALFPPRSNSGDTGGWMYLNLSNTGSRPRASQNWVVTMMSAEGRYSVMFDATMLSNGCTPPLPATATIGPAPDGAP